MIEARHTYWGTLFFDWYSRIQLRRHFKQINLCGTFEDKGRPILVIANHFSWWDGFIQLWFNNKILRRKFHVMMLEEQLRKFMILNKGGAFSIRKNNRDIIESLQYASQLLKASSNLLVIFPQGEIQTLYKRDFVFKKGVEYIIRKAGAENIDILFNVNLTDYFSNKTPALNIYFEQYDISKGANIESIQHFFNEYVKECVDKQVES